MAKLGDGSLPDKASVDDTYLMLVHNPGAGSDNDGQMTRAVFLAGVAMAGGDHDFGESEIDDLTATDASVTNLTVITGLQFDTGATISECAIATVSVDPGDLATTVGATEVVTLTGAASGDFLSISFTDALPDGLHTQAYISDTNEVSVRFYNSTSGTISAASYTAKLMAFRAS